MEKPRPTISETNWRRISKTLDFILSYPVKGEAKTETLQPVIPSASVETVVFERGDGLRKKEIQEETKEGYTPVIPTLQS